jgi:hypothetical protein
MPFPIHRRISLTASYFIFDDILDADGAIAEMYFHLRPGQPAMPSQVRCIGCSNSASGSHPACASPPWRSVQRPGFKPRPLGNCPMSNASARSEWPNVIVFRDPADRASVEVVTDHGLVDWPSGPQTHSAISPLQAGEFRQQPHMRADAAMETRLLEFLVRAVHLIVVQTEAHQQ